jgi:hypothetical protein
VKSPARKGSDRASSNNRIDGSAGELALDSLATEVLDNVHGILKRRGRALEEDIFSQLLTWWWNDPQYCCDGVPIPLPPKGAAPSIAALVRRLGGRHSLRAAMNYLTSTNSVKQAGTFYVPTARWVRHRKDRRLRYSHHFWALVSFLRTLTHNADLPEGKAELFEYIASNSDIPASKLNVVHASLEEAAKPFLIAQDSTLTRYARAGRRGERKARVMIGVWVSEGGLMRPAAKVIGERKKGPGGAIKRS